MEQKVYDKDRDDVISRCKEEMKAVITSDPNPETFEKTLSISERYKGFVFPILGIHPEYVERFTDGEIDVIIGRIRRNSDKIVGIGETGLDYYYIRDEEQRERQRGMFRKFIQLSIDLDLPVCCHIRNGEDKSEHNAFRDAVSALEEEGAKKVHLHMFGSRKLLKRVIKNGWYISENAIILRSKNYKKVVRDTPMNRLMLETDAPWLHPSGDNDDRNDPMGVKAVAEKIAEIKKVPFEDVVHETTKSASEFYNLF